MEFIISIMFLCNLLPCMPLYNCATLTPCVSIEGVIRLHCCIASVKAAISVTIRPVNKDNVSHAGFLTAALQSTKLIGGHNLKRDGGGD